MLLYLTFTIYINVFQSESSPPHSPRPQLKGSIKLYLALTKKCADIKKAELILNQKISH